MKGILVETDILVEYLTSPAAASSLFRRLLCSVVCYSTFVQAAEIYSAAVTPEERRTVDRALFGLKVLGANSRYAKTIGDLLSSLGSQSIESGSFEPGNRLRIATVAAMAIESDLPVVTEVWAATYRSIPRVRVLTPQELDRAIDVGTIREFIDRSA